MMLISNSEQIFFEDLGSVSLHVFQELEYEYWKTFYPMIIAESSFIYLIILLFMQWTRERISRDVVQIFKFRLFHGKVAQCEAVLAYSSA